VRPVRRGKKPCVGEKIVEQGNILCFSHFARAGSDYSGFASG
jgi:hypothetical protein